jgi:Xaa-Pro aminopeptidase
MTVDGVVYEGDEALARALADAGATMGLDPVKALIAGVAAAPDGADEAAWTRLVTPEPGTRLVAQLLALKAGLAAAGGGGSPEPAVRLAALRARLSEAGYTGFLVPHADEHQNEFLPRRAERLAWLTGFTGSAGLAVILADTAAIFVDGRYTLQVRDQVEAGLYETLHLTEAPPADWIAAHLPAGGRLAYDPWLHTPSEVERIQAACARARAELMPSETNPLDAAWRNQPPPPIAPVVPHDIRFTGTGSVVKRRELAAGLERRKADAAVLSTPASIAWLLNIRGGDVPRTPLPLGFAILATDGRVRLFMDGRKASPELARHLGPDVTLAETAAFGPALDALGAEGACVLADPASAPTYVFNRLEDAGARILRGDDPCTLPKAVKTAVEIAGARAAHLRDGAALTRFLAWLAATAPAGGVSEVGAATELAALRAEGEHFRDLSFDTISGAGANGAIVHYHATPDSARILAPGMLYLVDSGGQYLDGTTDVTRTVFIAGNDAIPQNEARDRFTRVLKGHIAIATARFPAGTAGMQLDTLARQALWAAGVDYDHGTGHGVGSYLGVHEGPQGISKRPGGAPLEPGMIVSNEPGYYKTGAYGIRIENLITVVECPAPPGAERDLLAFETLTLAPIDLALVDGSLLTREEAAWLDAYHARVREALRPLLDDATGAWLAEATRAVA